jgi:hypothetical protein
MMKTQKDGTFDAVMKIIEKFSGKYDPKINYYQALTKPMKNDVVQELVRAFGAKEIRLEREQGEKIESYCVGLLNNWLRRDERLNGGTKYVGKVGNADPAIREARKLLNSGKITDPNVIAHIEQTITKMVADKKGSSVEIDVSKLPDELKQFAA